MDINIAEISRNKIDRYEAENEALKAKLSQIRYLVEKGLSADGQHHKQHFLAQIAYIVGVSVEEKGIAP